MCGTNTNTSANINTNANTNFSCYFAKNRFHDRQFTSYLKKSLNTQRKRLEWCLFSV